jgi:acetolactate synthase-1/2/3 large subunit
VAQAAQLLATAQRPVIIAGNGVTLAEASAELRELAERIGAPVATTLMAKGIFPEDHQLALGMIGIWGSRAANETANGADVIVAIGTGFAEADCSSWNPKYTFAIPPTRLIQIDLDPQEIGKIYPVEVGIVGDARLTLRELVRAFERPHRACLAPRVLASRADAKAGLGRRAQDESG